MRQLDFKRIHYVLCCLLAFLIPFPFFFAPPAIILISVAWLLSGEWRDGLKGLKKSPVLLAWLLFYALHIVSYFISTNKAAAAFDLELKMSFAVLPLVLSGSFYRHSGRFAGLLFSFVAGLTVIALWCLGRAAVLYFSDGQFTHFFYHALAKGTEANAVYLSWYTLSALSLLILIPWQRAGFPKIIRWRWFFITLLTVFLILLSSRLILILFLLLLIVTLVRQWFSGKRKNPVVTGGALLGGLFLLGLIAFTENPVSRRFHEVLNKNIEQSFYPDYRNRDQSFSNFTLRVFLWRVGLENIAQQQLWLSGTGTGDVIAAQDKRMHELGIRDIYHKTSPSPYAGISLHNMYVQSLVALGLPGLLLMCFLAGWPLGLRRKWPEKSAFRWIMLISTLFFCQESALQTQAGVVFYVFCSVTFYNRYQAVKNTRH